MALEKCTSPPVPSDPPVDRTGEKTVSEKPIVRHCLHLSLSLSAWAPRDAINNQTAHYRASTECEVLPYKLFHIHCTVTHQARGCFGPAPANKESKPLQGQMTCSSLAPNK